MQILGLKIERSAPKVRVTGTAFEARSLSSQIASTKVSAFTAAAPKLPPYNMRKGNDGSIINIQPPFGTNPPTGPVTTADGNLSDRLVTNDPRELWYLSLPSKLSPKQVLQILRSALGGDLWQQWQLHSLMMDSWPMYRKCLHELFEPVSNARYVVRPYCPVGDEPSPLAQEKADLMRRAMSNFDPNQFTDEKGWQGFVYNSCDAVANGMAMNEIIWGDTADMGFGMERLPRATAWVHPRHFTFTNDGKVAVFDQDYNRLQWTLAGAPDSQTPDGRKFICAQFMSRSGSSLGAGFMRPLAWYWAAVVFNREWMLKTAQNYGSPFLNVTYDAGMLAADLQNLDNDMAAGLANRFIRHVTGTTLEIEPPGNMGTDNPQRHMMEQADQACAFLLLGQEATTKTQPGQMGGKDDSKEEVKRERVEGVAKWIGTEVLTHFVRAVLLTNYGSRPEQIAKSLAERPTIEPDFTAATDPMAQAQRDQVFLTAGVPMLAEEFYRGNNLTMPEENDIVIKGGVLGKMAALQEDVGAPEPQLGPDGLPLNEDGTPQTPIADPNEDSVTGTAVTLRNLPLDKIFAKATTQELEALLPLVAAAEKATHLNGEHGLLTRHLLKIKQRK